MFNSLLNERENDTASGFSRESDSRKHSQVFVILGMHKSGTTLVSRLLMESGIDMGVFDCDKVYAAGNHFERLETQSINKELLACGNRSSLRVTRPLDIKKIKPEWWLRGETLVASLNDKYKAWGFKDPRNCLTYAYWEKILPPHHVIVIYRDPREVVRHYYQRRLSLASVYRSITSLYAWCVYNQCVLDVLERCPSALILNYAVLMKSDNEIKRLQKFLAVPVPDAREHAQYRSVKVNEVVFNLLAASVFFTTGRNSKRIERALEMRMTQQRASS